MLIVVAAGVIKGNDRTKASVSDVDVGYDMTYRSELKDKDRLHRMLHHRVLKTCRLEADGDGGDGGIWNFNSLKY